jgi:hypothetical protein
MPTLQEIKDYLGIDGGHNDPLLNSMMDAARELVESILRYPIAKVQPPQAKIGEAIKIATACLFAGRETADIQALEKTLRTFLSSIRKNAF